MIGWLLDTNVIAALINPNGAPSVKRWATDQKEETFFLSILTLAEYDKGIANLAEDHPERWRYAAARDALEARFSGRILSLDDSCVRLWGRISGEARRKTGVTPPVIDTLLAATAVVHGLYLATRNGRDMRQSGAVVFNPWQDDAADFPLSPRR